METKQDKFARMLDIRLPKALKAIDLLTNLSRKSDYEWTEEQANDMITALDKATTRVEYAFTGLASVIEALPEPAPAVDVPVHAPGAVGGYDRAAIRAALLKLTCGDETGVVDLRKVVLGWAPEPRGEDNAASRRE